MMMNTSVGFSLKIRPWEIIAASLLGCYFPSTLNKRRRMRLPPWDVSLHHIPAIKAYLFLMVTILLLEGE